jgi:subtilisin family serine protease
MAATLMFSALATSAYAPPASTDALAAFADLDTKSAIVVLKGDPLATYDGRIRGYEKTRPDRGKVNPNSAAAKKYMGYLRLQHSEFQRWLQRNVPSAKITSEYFTVLNGVAVSLNGNAIGKLAQNADVLTVEYNALYQPDMSESHKIINAAGAWTEAGGRAGAGAGVKVGVIDSGIDSSHPFFDPAGFSYPSGFPKCDAIDSASGQADQACEHVTAKVIVAKVFDNKQNQHGFDAAPVPGEGDHGTHVSGTIAGVTGVDAVVNGVTIDDMSGVAPGAWLGNYNVFPGSVVSARSEDILNAVEAAVLDGMDVLNLSLGGGYRGNNDLLAKGLDAAVAANVVVVASAGNEGPGPFTIGSPGRARDIITVGASTNQHYVGQQISYGSGTTIGAAVGDFDALPAGPFDLFVSGGTSGLSNACSGLPDASTGNQVVLVTRGTCSFSTKVRSAIAAGYVGAIVRNNVAGDPSAMGADGLGDDDLPAVMVSQADGNALRTAAPATITVGATFAEFVPTGNEDILAGFSSQGPTFVDYAIKPDLTSVGVNVLSSIPCGAEGTTCGGEGTWAFFQGTSMSSPHVAGSAAVLLDLNPTWTPADVKSALANTADHVVKNAFNASTTVGPMAQGGGRENLTAASLAAVSFSPVSASFGRINASRVNSTTLAITISNLTGSAITFSVGEQRFIPAPTTGAGAISPAFNAGTIGGADDRIATPTSITVAANGTAPLTLTVNAGLPNGSVVQGWITLDGPGDNDYHFAYWAEVAP